MSKYGIPYKGSKAKIAEDILSVLPSGNRLVDLFGGGFAITDCALRKFSNKYNRFYYNDINPLLSVLINDAIKGKYNPNIFIPKFITRDEFYKQKEKDGYIKWIWSFGNNGNDYIYGKNKEEIKREMHNLVVYNIAEGCVKDIVLTSDNLKDRRLELQRKIKDPNLWRLQHLERLQRLNQLESLTRLEPLARLEPLTRLDYRDYIHKDGDVVYCDIPYENSKNKTDYGGGFDNNAFYEWAKNQPYDVYYSSYTNTTNGEVIWEKEVRSVMNSAKGGVKRKEMLIKL